MTTDWIDVSVALRSGMVHWPDDPEVVIELERSLEGGDHVNVSKLSMGSHTGTHMDAPLHFFTDGTGLDELDFDTTIGPARVIGIEDPHEITTTELDHHEINEGERVLFKTRNSPHAWNREGFVEDFVYIPAGTARYLADKRVKLVGVDYLSVGGYKKDGVDTHRALLGAGIFIIEGLDLSPAEPGDYDLVCLPVKVEHSDGAPARVLLRPR